MWENPPAIVAPSLRPDVAHLERFLRAQGPQTHALLLTGGRSSAAALAEAVWDRALSQGHAMLAVGRRLASPARAGARPGLSLLQLPEPGALPPRTLARHLDDSLTLARSRGYRGLTVLVAPGEPVPQGLRALDAELDAAAAQSAAQSGAQSGAQSAPMERYCLYPRAWLRREAPLDAVDLVNAHPTSLELP